jgi:hypothetical protein
MMSDSRKGFTKIRQHSTSADSGEAVKGTILSSDLELANQYMEARAVVPSGVWQFYFDGEWTTGMNTNDHRANTKAAGFLIRDLWLKKDPTQ